jgi:tetratricopeptide (TPR) repeat protein
MDAANWIADNGAGSPYELPALVIVARQADDSVAAADDASKKARQAEAAEIYARLAALVGESPEAIAGVKNALAVNSKLAHYDESLGRWKEAATRLDKIVAALPSDKKYLRRAGIAHFQAGEYAPALDQWRKLLGGVESGSEEWFEAKYHQLACLTKTDRASAVKVWKQFKLLFPQVKSAAWKDKFAALEADLGK